MINISQNEKFTEIPGTRLVGNFRKAYLPQALPEKSGKNIICRDERAEFTFTASCGNKTKKYVVVVGVRKVARQP
jgi:hypothetical protein